MNMGCIVSRFNHIEPPLNQDANPILQASGRHCGPLEALATSLQVDLGLLSFRHPHLDFPTSQLIHQPGWQQMRKM